MTRNLNANRRASTGCAEEAQAKGSQGNDPRHAGGAILNTPPVGLSFLFYITKGLD